MDLLILNDHLKVVPSMNQHQMVRIQIWAVAVEELQQQRLVCNIKNTRTEETSQPQWIALRLNSLNNITSSLPRKVEEA